MKQHLARALQSTIGPITERPQRPDGFNGRTWGDHAEKLASELESQGFTIVPVEPSVEMQIAGERAVGQPVTTVAHIYKAMLKAHEGQD